LGFSLQVNYAQPMKIKGGDKGWSHQPVWADADKYMQELEAEQEFERLEKEQDLAARRKTVEGVQIDSTPDAMQQLEAAAG